MKVYQLGQRLKARKGLSLLEVMMALVVMVLGVLPLLALFPLGVRDVRQTVIDTQSTLMAYDARGTIQALRLIDDRALVPYLPEEKRYNVYCNPSDTGEKFSKNTTYSFENDPTGGLITGSRVGYPIYVDPVMSLDVTSPTVLINVKALAPFNNLINPPVYATGDAIQMPVQSKTRQIRAAYLRRWFKAYTTGPRLAQPNGAVGGTSTTDNTNGFSWSFAVTDRPLVWASYIAVQPGQPAPPLNTYYWKPINGGKIHVLVFYHRPVSTPIRILRMCLFQDSQVATVSWPQGTGQPNIRQNTWLVEMTMSGYQRSSNERRKIAFYRVSNVETPMRSGGDWVQKVTFSEGVRDFPVVWDGSAGIRQVPDPYSGNTFPINIPAGQAQLANVRVWVPGVMFPGLVEVFEVTE